ncbi:hypothetical protein [Cupriavidus sp. AU9028]|uniref:hypothetical protein n=1 Tax=Cupriavidus sp. AU9028 TaxID=2871157 RepID=UPI001C95FC90|nr:hypothetical protein [Cupriavidus sp. AU9028]MBY4899144.1 hypothetical protein [Cupriavidus sp. AU9028]
MHTASLTKALLVVCLTTVALAACGGNDDEPVVTPQPPADPTPAPAKPELRCAP